MLLALAPILTVFLDEFGQRHETVFAVLFGVAIFDLIDR